MSDVVIDAADLTKRFGVVTALDDLSLTVVRGEVFGFLGPNGAGKSTTIRILLDLVRPTSGNVNVLDLEPRDRGPELRRRVGYLPGELRMHGRSTAGAYLRYLTRLRNGGGGDRIADLADRFELDLTRPIGKLSKGNKQKVGVIQAFAHNPELLILDEPTSGLDPLLRRQFQDLVKERSAEGATVFMSSHVLSEIEDVADRVAVIRSGQLVDIESIPVLRHRAGQEIEFRFADRIDVSVFEQIAGISNVVAAPDKHTGGDVLRCVLRGEPDELLKAAAQHSVVGWNAADRDLDDLFLDYYREDKPEVENVTDLEDASHG